MDEVQQLDVGRKHPAGKYSHLRAILSEIRGGVRGGGRDGARGYHPKRDRWRTRAGECRRVRGRKRTRSAWSRSSARCSSQAARKSGRSTTITICLAAPSISSRGSAFKKYVNTVAWHGYVGSPEMMGNVKQKFPDVEMHWTEGGDDYKFADYLTNWSKWGRDLRRHSSQRPAEQSPCGIWLSMSVGRPNIGPSTAAGWCRFIRRRKRSRRRLVLGAGPPCRGVFAVAR